MQHVREHLSTVPGKMSGMSVQLASLPQSTRDRLTDLWQEINKSEEQAAEQRVEDSEYPPVNNFICYSFKNIYIYFRLDKIYLTLVLLKCLHIIFSF